MLSSTASVPTTVATILRLRNAIAIPDRRTIDWDDRLHYGRRSSLSERCDGEHVDGQHDEEGAETPFTGLSANERVSAMCSTGRRSESSRRRTRVSGTGSRTAREYGNG